MESNNNSNNDNNETSEKTLIRPGNEGILELTDTKRSCLIVIHGPNLGKKYNLDSGSLLIGRTESVDIRINEDNVSRRHAKILILGNNKIIIKDLNSTNGIFINTKKVKSAILKDGDLILIGNTIFKFISSSNIETAYHEEIYKLATLDSLTHAYNKKHFLEQLSIEFSRTKRYNRVMSLILFDFDNFKKVNDVYGHLAGDYVLKKSASVTLRNLRKEDLLGRYGGEEFAIILPETSQAKAFQIAEKIRVLIEGIDFIFNKQWIPVTISAGVVSCSASTPVEDYNDLIEAVDIALYKAKKNGKNCVVENKLE